MKAETLAMLIASCAPQVHPYTMSEIIRVESEGNPLAININKLNRKPPPMESSEQVAALAKKYIAKGYSVDLGLAQINSINLAWLGQTVETILDPCTNIRAGATIVADAYARAPKVAGDEQAALKAALSAYNTGSYHRGFLNGYVAKYYPAGDKVDAIQAHAEPLPPETQAMSAYEKTLNALMAADEAPS